MPSDQTPDDELLHQFRAQLSKMSSEEIHRILQTAFGWFDAHLWRFTAGGAHSTSPSSSVPSSSPISTPPRTEPLPC